MVYLGNDWDELLADEFKKDYYLATTQEGLKGYYEQEQDSFASPEEFEAHYTRPFMEDCIRWDKAFEIMVRDAVSSLD